ncbi:MAG TPA: GrpB family protein [Kribbella sp.]
MPFTDEINPAGVAVHPHCDSWRTEGAELAAELQQLVPNAAEVEHIGSTSIPGMAAKDCLDMMILVADLTSTIAEQQLAAAGWRRRPEPWNNFEPGAGRDWPKMVFAPPIGARSCNVHVRVINSPTARIALLFRDYLSCHPAQTQAWSSLKAAIAALAPDLATYGSIKSPAWQLLMELAERWATDTGWQPYGAPTISRR